LGRVASDDGRGPRAPERFPRSRPHRRDAGGGGGARPDARRGVAHPRRCGAADHLSRAGRSRGLCSGAGPARPGEGAGGDLFAEGLHPVDATVPGHLRLLHVSDRSPVRPGPVHDPRGCPGRGAGRGAAGLSGGAVHPRRAAGAAVPRGAPVARRTRTPEHALLPARDGRPRAAGDDAAAASQSRHDEPRGDGFAPRRLRVDGPDAGEREPAALRPWGAARARPEQTPSGAPPHARGRRRVARPLHHGPARGHRRDARGTRGDPRGHPRVARALGARPGDHHRT
jgi:hypothetical protein